MPVRAVSSSSLSTFRRLSGKISTLIQTSISRKVQVRLELANNLPPVEGDSGQLQQVIMNLITNASEAIGDGCRAGGVLYRISNS